MPLSVSGSARPRVWSVVAVALALAGCRAPGTSTGAADIDASRDARRGVRDVVLITIDTLRHDATGFSGARKVDTPIMDRLAAGGVEFPFAHAHAVVTLPSHASILTGLLPFQHGIRDNAGFILPAGTPTLASVLRGAGFATAAFVSAFPLDRRFGLDQGFDVYDDEYRRHGSRPFVVPERPGSETVARAKRWWDANAGRPRLLWVHLFAPHAPYDPPEPYASRYRQVPYYGEAALADAQLAPLLEPILTSDDHPPLVVLTSDHGESLGEHGEPTHGLFAYEATLRVPLVLWAPGMLGRGVDRRAARHIDIVPTVLDLLGVDAPPGLAGRSLARPDPGGDLEVCDFEALSGHLNRGWAPLVGRIEGRRKAIRLPIPELYDLERDPAEAHNLAPGDPSLLDDTLSRVPAGVLERVDRSPLDAEVVERLRSLGYLSAAGSPRPGAESDVARDPKRLMPVQALLDDAAARFRSGDADGAVAILERVVAEHPEMAIAYTQLGMVLAEAGRRAEAAQVLSKAVELGIADESLRTLLALNLVRAGRPREAWTALAGDLDSRNPQTQLTLAAIADALGRTDDARARLVRAIEIDPTFPDAQLDLGLLLVRLRRPQEALPHLEAAVEGNPYLAKGWNALGVLRIESGDVARAVDAWDQATRADPAFPDPYFNLGLALGKAGDYDQAVRALERYVGLVEGPRRERGLLLLETFKRRKGRT